MSPRRITIAFPDHMQEVVWAHLRSNDVDEEAAFLFAEPEFTAKGITLHVRGSYLVPSQDFECHAHPGWRPAVFSIYDFEGFSEFVPHVRWRLQDRPYAAIVVAGTTFDALAWIEPGNPTPVAVDAVTSASEILYPTRQSLVRWQEVTRGRTV